MSKLDELSEVIHEITRWVQMGERLGYDNTIKAMLDFLRNHRTNIIKRGY